MDSKAQDDKVAAPASALLRECRDAVCLTPVNEYRQDLLKRIDAHIAAGSGEGWVACSERMPTKEESRTWLLVMNGGDRHAARFMAGQWYEPYTPYQVTLTKVTHWQPLPLPPAPQESEK